MDTSSVQDPLLRSTLASAAQTRQQSLSILDFLDQQPATTSSHLSDPTNDAFAASQLELSRHQKLLNANLARLRRQHRASVFNARDTKQNTAEAKSEIDSLHLQLQNLFYEQRHLRGEIGACEDYRHKYLSLSLIPAEDFLAPHPDLHTLTEHDLMIARINDERAQRMALEDQRQVLIKKKQSLVAENKKKKDELDALDREIEKFVNGADAVRKVFEARDKRDAQQT